jgi:hypothetical protein
LFRKFRQAEVSSKSPAKSAACEITAFGSIRVCCTFIKAELPEAALLKVDQVRTLRRLAGVPEAIFAGLAGSISRFMHRHGLLGGKGGRVRLN